MEKYIYQRTPSFLGVPIAKSKGDIKGYDAAVLGIPWEGSVTWGHGTGTDLGTRTIRDASARYSGFLPEYNINIFDHLKVCDYSDVDIVPGDIDETFRRFSGRIQDILEAEAFPIVIGGDHGITYPVVKTLGEAAAGQIGIVHFDAHYDNKDEFEGDPLARCCPLQRISEIPSVKTSSIVHVGIRGPRNSKTQAEFAASIGATTFTNLDVRRRGIEDVIAQAYKIAADGTDKIYVTVCSDALDVAYNPGGPPDPNGLTSLELSIALYNLASWGIHGFDIVEIYPPGDPNHVASHVGAWLIQYVLAGLASRKSSITEK